MTSYGRTTIAESKMMFYPTDRIEQYRLFFFLTDLGRVEITTKKLVEHFYGKQYQIDAINQPFDPEYHNAVLFVEDERFDEPTVVEELQKGYQRGDKIIRYSMVKVSN